MAADLNILLSQLNTSGLLNQNPALYQVIKELIQNLKELQRIVGDFSFANVEDEIETILNAPFVMSEDAATTFPSSRELLAGTNINIDNTIPNETTVSVEEHNTEEIAAAIYPDYSFVGNPWGNATSPYSTTSPWEYSE